MTVKEMEDMFRISSDYLDKLIAYDFSPEEAFDNWRVMWEGIANEEQIKLVFRRWKLVRGLA